MKLPHGRGIKTTDRKNFYAPRVKFLSRQDVETKALNIVAPTNGMKEISLFQALIQTTTRLISTVRMAKEATSILQTAKHCILIKCGRSTPTAETMFMEDRAQRTFILVRQEL